VRLAVCYLQLTNLRCFYRSDHGEPVLDIWIILTGSDGRAGMAAIVVKGKYGVGCGRLVQLCLEQPSQLRRSPVYQVGFVFYYWSAWHVLAFCFVASFIGFVNPPLLFKNYDNIAPKVKCEHVKCKCSCFWHLSIRA